MSERNDKFWFGFFLGGLLGALTLFFVGTREGKKAGKQLKNSGEDLIDTIQEQLEELKVRGKELARQGEEIKEEVAERITLRKDQITEDAKSKIDTILAHIEEIQERGRQATENIRKEFKNIPKKS